MARGKTAAQIKAGINKLGPGASDARLADVIYDLTNQFNALLTKLDSNHGAATDHSSTLAVKLPEART